MSNALHAVKERRGEGRIFVEIGPLGEDRARVRVVDNGTGVPVPLRERIFDPFVTTRPCGTAFGLGLTVCRRLFEALHGELLLTASSAEGATFDMILPRSSLAG